MGRISAVRRCLAAALAADEATAQRIASRLQIVVALGAAVLLGATWKLWTPQTEFPRIPLVGVAESIPDAFEWLGAVLLGASLGSTLVAPTGSWLKRRGLLLFSAVMAFMILCDQQRLQTWAYQFAILGVVLSLVPPQRGVIFQRLFVASIYLHSALSKLSMGFLETTGPVLVLGLLKALRVDVRNQLSVLERGLEILLPLAELIVGLLLCCSRSRRTGLWFSLGMHLLLILALGPLGLNHKPGVLLWNTYFVMQNVVLFGPLIGRTSAAVAANPEVAASDRAETSPVLPAGVSPPGRFAECLVVAAIVLPFLEPFGLFDHWPSWAVYAGGTERVEVYVDAATRGKLPETLQQYTTQPANASSWCRVFIDRWTLDRLAAPIYPEDRLQLGVALWISRYSDTGDGVFVTWEGRADRWTNQRSWRVLTGSVEIERELDTFWCNGYPRKSP